MSTFSMNTSAAASALVANSTGTTTERYALSHEMWAVYEAASIILTIIALYVFVVLIHYSCVKTCANKRRLRRRQASTNVAKENNYNSSSAAGGGAGGARGGSTSSTEGGRKKRSDGTGKSARPLRTLCLSAAFVALVRMCADQLELGTHWGIRVNCKQYQVIVVVLYATAAALNYIALWVRLRIFFSHPVMKHLASKLVNCLIWFSLAAVIGSAIFNTTLFAITVDSKDSAEGCILGESLLISQMVRYVLLTISSVGSQLLLLSLFLYPLLKHRASTKLSLSGTPSKTSTYNRGKSAAAYNSKPHPQVAVVANADIRRVIHSARTESDSDTGSIRSGYHQKSGRDFKSYKKQKRENRLMKIVRRVLITAIVCVASDILSAVIGTTLNNKPRIANNLVFNTNLMINIFSVLMSFGDWQERLFPLCASRLRKMLPPSRATSASSLESKKKTDRTRTMTDSPRLGNTEPHYYPNIDSVASLPTPSQPADDDDVFTDSRSHRE